MKKYNHWVFDLDGTILDSSSFYESFIQLIFSEFGLKVSQAELDLAYKYFNPEEYFAQFLSDPRDVKRAVDRLLQLNEENADQVPAFAGIEELLGYLQNRNVHLSAWTGRELKSARLILEHLRLSKYFHLCVGRTCIPRNKPYPDGLLKILNEFRHHHDDVLMIGDHEYDMKGARAAKVAGVSVSWDAKALVTARELSDFHFDRVSDMHSWAVKMYG